MNPFELYYRANVASGSRYETQLYQQLGAAGLKPPQVEFRFHPKRLWRFDFAYPEEKIGIEVEGGIWNGGRHTRGAGYEGDCEKYNQAVLAGWRVLRFTPKMVKDGSAAQVVRQLMPA